MWVFCLAPPLLLSLPLSHTLSLCLCLYLYLTLPKARPAAFTTSDTVKILLSDDKIHSCCGSCHTWFLPYPKTAWNMRWSHGSWRTGDTYNIHLNNKFEIWQWEKCVSFSNKMQWKYFYVSVVKYILVIRWVGWAIWDLVTFLQAHTTTHAFILFYNPHINSEFDLKCFMCTRCISETLW